MCTGKFILPLVECFMHVVKPVVSCDRYFVRGGALVHNMLGGQTCSYSAETRYHSKYQVRVPFYCIIFNQCL